MQNANHLLYMDSNFYTSNNMPAYSNDQSNSALNALADTSLYHHDNYTHFQHYSSDTGLRNQQYTQYEAKPTGNDKATDSNSTDPSNSTAKYDPSNSTAKFDPSNSADRYNFSKSSRADGNSAVYTTNTAGYAPNSTAFDPNAAGYPPNNTGYPLNSVEYAPNSAGYASNSAEYASNSAGYPLNRDEYAPNSVGYASNRAEYAPNSTAFDPNSGGYAPHNAVFHHNSSGFDANSARYDSNSLEVNRTTNGAGYDAHHDQQDGVKYERGGNGGVKYEDGGDSSRVKFERDEIKYEHGGDNGRAEFEHGAGIHPLGGYGGFDVQRSGFGVQSGGYGGQGNNYVGTNSGFVGHVRSDFERRGSSGFDRSGYGGVRYDELNDMLGGPRGNLGPFMGYNNGMNMVHGGMGHHAVRQHVLNQQLNNRMEKVNSVMYKAKQGGKRELPPGVGLTKGVLKDKNAPKKPLSSYIYFSNTMREVVKKEDPGISFLHIAREIGKRWKELSDEDKKPYKVLAEQDKERYRKQLAAYEPTPGFVTAVCTELIISFVLFNGS